MDTETQLRTLYSAFNARDIDATLAGTHPDVDWPNGWEGGRVRGHAAVREYWTRQWAEIDPHVEPRQFESRPDGRIAVHVHQTVRDRAGALLAEGTVIHVYTMSDGLVSAMDIEEPEE